MSVKKDVLRHLKYWKTINPIDVTQYYRGTLAEAIVLGQDPSYIESVGSAVCDMSEEDGDRYDRVMEVLREMNIGK